MTGISQDTLYTRNGDEVKVKVLLVTMNSVTYKKSDNLDGPTYEILKSETAFIKYQNGTKDIFYTENTIPKKHETIDASCFQAQKDAKKYYHRIGFSGAGTLITCLASPLLGLIPAILCSSTTPNNKRLDYPNAELMKNNVYNECYTNAARSKKSKRVWTYWGIGLGVNIAVATILLISDY